LIWLRRGEGSYAAVEELLGERKIVIGDALLGTGSSWEAKGHEDCGGLRVRRGVRSS